MPISDPSKILFSTAYNYFLNYDDETGSVDVPSTSYAPAEVKSYNISVPVSRTKDFSQVQVNFSFDSTKWYVFPFGQIVPNLDFSIETRGSYSSGSLNLTFYVVNQSFGVVNSPAFTATVKALLFVTPT